MSKKFRILCIDGGGLRGIVPVLILQHIESMQGVKIHSMFDMVSGTSAGGIIASGLVASSDGISPDLSMEILSDLYSTHSTTIFPPPKNFIGRVWMFVTSLLSPRYSTMGLKTILSKYFGNLKLSNSLKLLVIPSYDLINQEVIVFKSRKASEDGQDALLSDVCMATSAAPTYFPGHTLVHNGSLRLLVDAGIFANNPAIIAISEAIKMGVSPQDIEIISIGTGKQPPSMSNFRQNMGLLEWACNILDVTGSATSNTITYQSNYIVGKNLRLDISFPCKVDFTDTNSKTHEIMKKCVQDQIIDNDKVKKQIRAFFS